MTNEGCRARVNRTHCYSENYVGHPVEAAEAYVVRCFSGFPIYE